MGGRQGLRGSSAGYGEVKGQGQPPVSYFSRKEMVRLVLLFFAIFLLPYLLFYLLLRWLVRRRILTWQRFAVVHVLAALAFADFLFTPILYMLPKTIWPPLHPVMTWGQVVEYLGYIAPGDTAPRMLHMALDLFKTRPAGFWLTQVPWALAAYPLLAWAWRSGWPARRGEPEAARQAVHGSARWRRPGELKTTLHVVTQDRPGAAGVVVGSERGRAWLTRPEVGNPHVLLVGATRSGKSRRVILPTIWTLAHAKESMILTDPKGELHAHTAAWLKSQGYAVIQLDLLAPARGNRWNPLEAVSKAAEEGDLEEASRLAWEIGHILAWSAGPGTDPIWPQAEESLIAALCLATSLEAPPEARHMATAYRMLTEMGARGGQSLDAWIESLPPAHPAKQAYGTAALSESRTRASIYTGTAAHLRLFGDPGVAWMTAASDHDPAEAGLKPTAIFLLLPDEAGARRDIASLYINQAYGALAGVARQNGGQLPVPTWFLLDEFGNIGKLPNMAEKLTVAAGRGIRFVLAVQALAQVAHVYGEKASEILIGNCDTWLFLRTSDVDTAKVVSQKAGTYTVKTMSVQRRPGTWSLPGGTEAAAARPLLTPDEVLRWPAGQALLLQAGQHAARLPLADLSAWKEASKAFRPAEVPDRPPRVGEVPTWVPELPEPEQEKQEKDAKGGEKKRRGASVLSRL